MTKKKMKSNDWDELRKIIDDGMERCDREIFIGFYESATLVTVKPMANEGKEKLPEATKNELEKPKNEIIVRVPYSKDAKMEAVCCKEKLEELRIIYALFEGRPVSELSDWELEKVEEITTLVYKFIDLRKGLCRLLLKKYGIFII